MHSRVRTLVWIIARHMGSVSKIDGITEQDRKQAINSLCMDPAQDSADRNALHQRPSFNWLNYLRELKEEADSLPFESPAVLTKLDQLSKKMHEVSLELISRFQLPFNELSVLETLLPRSAKSLQMLIKRDEKTSRTLTTSRNAPPAEEENQKEPANLSTMIGAGSGTLGNQAYARASKENTTTFVQQWMDCFDLEVSD
ncbi:hypothetical protein Ciccas_006375 [Cichlidogyrus casuarinus]|uniref:Uncharacterized protein n=1 Tax=Cichlidogyrus casuarinus TaxID=1844966 RepID=A0ABD2Q5X5_9PLAT